MQVSVVAAGTQIPPSSRQACSRQLGVRFAGPLVRGMVCAAGQLVLRACMQCHAWGNFKTTTAHGLCSTTCQAAA